MMATSIMALPHLQSLSLVFSLDPQVQSHRDAMAAKVTKRQQELQQLEKQLQEVLQEVGQSPHLPATPSGLF